ncbi:MAG: type II secretion system F family protein [Candidatus Aenigmarchaeota archaeon]|nr:type II secretion system F family protein [Candidatus Aenigmarchaeota archaeon]
MIDVTNKLEKKLMKKSRVFYKYAKKIAPYLQGLKVDLLQARKKYSLEEYIAFSIYSSLKTTIMMFITLIFMWIILEDALILKLAFASVPLFFIMMMYTILAKPKIMAKRMARDIDGELPYAMRHLLIEIRSGIPIYESLVNISEGYGYVSKEFKEIVCNVNGGKSEIEAIEDSILQSPSTSYRRSFWQILNSLKTGTTLEVALKNIVDNMLKEQLLSIKKYGQELNPLTLMYMLFAVIVPSLGITFLTILTTFTGGGIGAPMLYSILAVLIVFQVMFLNMIKSRRPVLQV